MSENTIGFMRVLSALGERFGFNRALGNDSNRRNLDHILRRKSVLAYRDFVERYDRKDIAGRIVDAFPDATWRKKPIISENEDPDPTEFEKAWVALEERLRCTHYFTRADKLAGLGHYSVILIGVKGGSALSTPLQPNALRQPSSIIYLSVFSEENAKVHTWVTDPKNERFGKPNMYRINFSGNMEGFTGVGTREVHWSRVIHIAEDLLEDEVHGRPRLERVFNLLEDLEKVVGGAAEMFYQGADRKLQFDIRENFDLDGDDKKAMREQIEELQEGLRPYLLTQGVDANTIGGATVDPSGAADKVLELIAGTTGIPKRILLGSEQGELASSQDETNFNGRVQERREDHAEPVILRAFIDRLAWLGVLKVPADGYTVEWPSLFEVSNKEKVGVVKDLATANRMMPGIVTAGEVRRDFLGYTYDLPKDEEEDDESEETGETVPDETEEEEEAGDEVSRTADDIPEGEAVQA